MLIRSAGLRQMRQGKVREKERYERRKAQVEVILRSVQNDLGDDINRINRKLNDAAAQQYSGFGGLSAIRVLSDEIRDDREKGAGADGELSGLQENLQMEVKCTSQKIDDLRREITSLDARIRNAEAQEAEERRKAQEEAMKNAMGNVWRV